MPTLDWIGKKAVVNHHREVPYRLLHCDKAKSAGDPDAGNLLVQGDNLEALKALLPYYAGKVKCIYIDPPFNTGSEEWIYNDNVSSPEIRAWLGTVVRQEGDDLSRHDKWLCMMYPRIALLREFLADEGTLFVHLDDNEIDHGIAIFDEVFDRRNRVQIITFKQGSATGHKAINPGCVNITNFILLYARRREDWKPKRLYTGRERDKRYGSYITNRSADYHDWRFTTLMQAFAASLALPLKEAQKLTKGQPELLDEFVTRNADSVIQAARPDYEGVGEETRKTIDESQRDPGKIFKVSRSGYSDIYLRNGKRILFYADKLKVIDGQTVSGEPLTTLWNDILSNNLHNEGSVDFPKGKKPEALIKRCIELSTDIGDMVLDSFAGSGTTAAVAQKMNRTWLAVEMQEHAESHVKRRLELIVQGNDQSGITKDIGWLGGGGFRFCTLGEPLFDENGSVNPSVTFADLAAHIFFCETGSPIPKRADGNSPLIGAFRGRAIYLLYAPDSMGFASEKAGNVLNGEILNSLPTPDVESYDGSRVVYAEGCTVPEERLREAGVTFKQVPYQIEGL